MVVVGRPVSRVANVIVVRVLYLSVCLVVGMGMVVILVGHGGSADGWVLVVMVA